MDGSGNYRGLTGKMAKNVVVVGTQWGDEGKGKIVDWLTDHTLVVGNNVYKLNLVPSGIVHPGIKCYIGNGVVLDIHHLVSEINELEAGGIEVRSRLRISPGCPLILGYHSALDRAREAAKSLDSRIGTTGKGIGPTYEDKVARRALRVYDLSFPERFAEKLKENLDYHNFVLTRYLGAEAVDFNTVLDLAMANAEQIKPMVVDVSAELNAANKAGQNLLFEGAQGALLDIDHGTYPFVTSSNCVAGQASARALGRACSTTFWVSPRPTVRGSEEGPSRASLISRRRILPDIRCRIKGVSLAPLPGASVVADGSMFPRLNVPARSMA